MSGTLHAFPNRMDNREPYVPKTQVASLYHVSTKTVERWLKDGCPSRKVQGKRVLQLSAVRAWLDEREAV